MFTLINSPWEKRTETGKKVNVRVGINSPFPPRRLDGRNPLLRQRFIARRAQLPRVTRVSSCGTARFDVEPEVVDGDAVGVDGGEEVVELGLDGFAGHAAGGAGALGWLVKMQREIWVVARGMCYLDEVLTRVHISVETGDTSGFGSFVHGNHIIIYGASLKKKWD